MSYSYLALISKSETIHTAIERDFGSQFCLRPKVSVGQVRIWSGSATPLVLTGGGGNLLGELFTSAGRYDKVHSLPADKLETLFAADAKALLVHFWGSYVCFVEQDDSSVNIYRDPSGSMPCYWIKGDGYIAIASDVEILWQAGVLVPDIGWSALARHLYHPVFRSEETVMSHVRELCPGDCLSITGHTPKSRRWWTPWDHTRLNKDTSSELSVRLALSVSNCIRARASCYPHITLAVSGGFDSSVIASVLHRENSNLSMFTLSTDEPDGDETFYTDILSSYLGLPIAKHDYTLSQADLLAPTISHLPRPVGSASMQTLKRLRQQWQQDRPASAFFSGVGGDNVFCYTQSASSLADRAKAEGLNVGLLDTLSDVCTLNDCSYLDAICNSLQAEMGHYVWRGQQGFLSSSAIAGVALEHRWTSRACGRLPGKIAHYAALGRTQAALEGLELGGIPAVTPLISQPIMEASLGIASWKWIEGGRDRAIARQAFDAHLPRRIARRRSKGGPDSFVVSMIENNRQVLRDYLLDGLITRSGILDSVKLEMALQDGAPLRAPMHLQLSLLMEAELWARHWTGRAKPASRR